MKDLGMKPNSNALELVTSDIWSSREAFESALVDHSLNFEREAGFALQILRANDYSLKLAASARQSIVDAVTNVAAIGISLNPALKHAYLVPRDGKICLDVSWMGLIELAVTAGAIMWAQARIVYEKDVIIDNGAGAAPTHTYAPFSKDRGEIVGAFCVAKLPGGDFLSEFLTLERLNSIRNRSESFKSGKNSPWKSDWSEMAKKSAVKVASKSWRGRGNSERLDKAIHFLNTDGGEGLGPINDTPVPQVLGFDPMHWIAEARAQKTEPELVKVYAAAMELAAKAGDREGAAGFKAAAMAHRAVLRQKLSDNTIDMERKAA